MSSTTSTTSPDTESARQQIAASEKEISTIKAQLRALGPATTEDPNNQAATNSLTVTWLKVRTCVS